VDISWSLEIVDARILNCSTPIMSFHVLDGGCDYRNSSVFLTKLLWISCVGESAGVFSTQDPLPLSYQIESGALIQLVGGS